MNKKWKIVILALATMIAIGGIATYLFAIGPFGKPVLASELRKNAKIDVNQKELQKLAVVPPGLETQTEADFRKAMTGGKPMVVDFGSNSCIPCRQLRPVLQKVRKDYTGKLEVLIIDIRNNLKLASDYQIQVIPTLVFFDPAGKEVFRHQGFMSEEKVKEQLLKMGVV